MPWRAAATSSAHRTLPTGRAALVVITNRGREQITTARRLIAEIGREREQRIGAERMAALHDALQTLAGSHDGDGKSRRRRPAPHTAASA